MEGLIITLCIVSGIFNLIMFVFCVKARSDCMELRDLYFMATNNVSKSMDAANESLQNARAQMVKMMEELRTVMDESDGDCKGEDS